MTFRASLLAGLFLLTDFVYSSDLGVLRGTQKVEDFTCSIAGAAGQDTCDASTADDGTTCVWCSLQSFGVCVSEVQADAMKKAIPGITCDDEDNDDDSVPDDDDDNNDDNVPDDYWDCLKNYSDADSCGNANCTWCDTKAGYGICFDKEAAESASKSDWFTCKMQDDQHVSTPHVMSCLAVSVQGDRAHCVDSTDDSGEFCEWCSMDSISLCVNKEVAEVAVELGGDCSGDIEDPFDTTCLAASVGGDETACKATKDQDGNPCQWCSVNQVPLCLTSDQAQIAQSIGGECSAESGKHISLAS